jgi:YqaJ-like viral recombinase domain
LLLTQIIKSIKEKEEEDDAAEAQLSKKRKKSGKSSASIKRQKLDSENDSSLINAKIEIHEEIKLVKNKKIVELNPAFLAKVEALKMENLIKSFGRGGFKDFQKHCVKVMNENSEAVQIANDLTVEQADTNIWHELRIGRITASRLHETTRCTMTRGSLVDKFMGKKSGWSFAMARGTILEEFVFEEVKKEYPELQRAGLMMNKDVNPFFAASPDGYHKDFVLEIKCPNTQNTFQTYIDVDKLSKKYFAQIQLQMLITGKKKALLAVASLDFEKTRKITKIWIPLDEDYMAEMIEQASEFYEKAIFPALKRKYLR